MIKRAITMTACLALSVAAFAVPVVAEDDEVAASGAGRYVVDEAKRTFSFKVDGSDGSFTGRARFKGHASGSVFKIALEYLRIEDDNVAYACGTVTEYTADETWVGKKGVFRAVDNGLGWGHPDQMSRPYGNIDVECDGVYTEHPNPDCPEIDLVEFFIDPTCGWPGADVLYDVKGGDIKVDVD